MDSNLFYDELIKRYMYLYENKELILSMCIRRINIDEKLKDDLKTYEEYKKRLLSSYKELLDDIIISIKSQLGDEKYYLCSNVSDDIVNAFEEFLFTDGDIEETDLYKHVESLKNNILYMDSVYDMISSLNERRQYNQWLKRVPTFTVWKILGYVRRNNLNNVVALEALDRYYNIDRTVMSGVDSDCGYELFGKECFDDDKLSKYPNMTILSGVSGSYVIFDYKVNEYEIEDDFICFRHDSDFEIFGEAKTIFMEMLSKMPNLDFDSKKNIYDIYNSEKELIL